MLLVLNVLVMNLFPAVMSFNLRKMIREDEEEKEHQALKAKQAEKQKENNGSAADDHEISQFEEHMVKLQVTTKHADDDKHALLFRKTNTFGITQHALTRRTRSPPPLVACVAGRAARSRRR